MAKKQAVQSEVKQSESIVKVGALLTVTFTGNKEKGKAAMFKDGAFAAKVLSVSAEGYVVVEYAYAAKKLMGVDYKRGNERGLLMVNGDAFKALALMAGSADSVVSVAEASAEHKALLA